MESARDDAGDGKNHGGSGNGGFDVFSLSTRQLGAMGESLAAMQLAGDGYEMLDRNWRCRYGELDLVALSADQLLVFVEVKTRRSVRSGLPAEAVTVTKQKHLRMAASEWLLTRKHKPYNTGVRFDVISIVVGDRRVEITHVPGAF
ncbi:YraN family protein [Bifidobacterium sp. BRDM6]|uniref:UPF0102 protein F6S87_06140 n=2 Tax=Bifidobacterium choloepi TaxID=2614131 RepID=A0A6I5NFQ7_9BIFI|nr:YraN family protein [Bifidobacterium choloepi]